MHQGCEPVAMGHKSLLQRRGAPSVVHYYRSAARKCSDGIEGALDSVAVVEHYRSRLQIPVIMASSSDFGWISPQKLDCSVATVDIQITGESRTDGGFWTHKMLDQTGFCESVASTPRGCGMLPLHLAVLAGADRSVLERMVQCYPSARAHPDDYGCLPLHWVRPQVAMNQTICTTVITVVQMNSACLIGFSAGVRRERDGCSRS